MIRFRDREDAGRRLAERLRCLRGSAETLVLAIPWGGMPTGAALARELGLPMLPFVSCKLQADADPGITLGAVTELGNAVLNPDIPGALRAACRVDDELLRARAEAAARAAILRAGRPLPGLRGKTVVLVDDGVVTGSTMAAALAAVRARSPAWLIAAAPVGAFSSLLDLRGAADQIVALEAPREFSALADYYEDFAPTAPSGAA